MLCLQTWLDFGTGKGELELAYLMFVKLKPSGRCVNVEKLWKSFYSVLVVVMMIE